jgi:hypothetical protein
MPQPTNAQLAASITSLLTAWNAREAEFRAWLGGAVGGGSNSDGRYPLSDATGHSILVLSPAALADTVSGPAALAEQAKQITEAACAAALGYRDAAQVQADRATSAKDAALAARDLAKLYRDEAAAFKATALDARDTAAAHAASIDPSNLVTKAELQAALDAL